MGLLRNKGIWLVTGVLLLMQLVIIYVPLMQSMFVRKRCRCATGLSLWSSASPCSWWWKSRSV